MRAVLSILIGASALPGPTPLAYALKLGSVLTVALALAALVASRRSA